MNNNWYSLPIPSDIPPNKRLDFLSNAAKLVEPSTLRSKIISGDTVMNAALNVLADLSTQGWQIRQNDLELFVHPPTIEADPLAEKERVRSQELLKRNEQLATPSVRKFIERMERPREYQGVFVSIFSLMRDGHKLADELSAKGASIEVIDPYIQVIANGDQCDKTGLRLLDIWRYFRYTWSNQMTKTPGRTMPLLVRDRAAPFHPVIGIAAISSAIIQIAERDKWIGWQPQDLIAHLEKNPELHWARWLQHRLEHSLNEIYLDDLIEDGLYWPSLWNDPTDSSIDKLRQEADIRRQIHNRFARKSDFKTPLDLTDSNAWTKRSESNLFRSKRCLILAELLTAQQVLTPYLTPELTRERLQHALQDNKTRRVISTIIRRAKAEAVGTEIADLTVCGAVPPYNAIIGGKLVGMLAISPTVVREYHKKYSGYISQITSSLAGKPIKRRSNLVFIGTTSLYGSNSSQYNRLRLPYHVLQSREDIVFRPLGRSRSFGTSHLSVDSVKALAKLAESSRTGVRVNSIFGEGVNPKLRKLRDAIDLLGWPSDELLQHRRIRLIYGVTLIDNLLPYLLGVDEEPNYLFHCNMADDAERISAWWRERWLHNRIQSEDILASLREHNLDRPVHHGARVTLPPTPNGTDSID